MRWKRILLLSVTLLAVMLGGPSEAIAAKKKRQARRAPSPPQSELVIESGAGRVLLAKNADKIVHPASLAKMMTLYLTFEALERREFKLSSTIRASSRAASMPNMNIGVEEGDRMTVDTAIDAVVVRSANDAAVMLGETIGGTEWKFAEMMTTKAQALGMKRTRFKNSTGLHHREQVTTARDMARLLVALERDFPGYYDRLSVRSFSWRGESYNTHNRVLLRYPWATGGKTGYIAASGYNLASAARRRGVDLVGVVIGGHTGPARDRRMIEILDRGFSLAENKGRKRSSMAISTEEVGRDIWSLAGDDTPYLRPYFRPWPSGLFSMEHRTETVPEIRVN